MESKFKKGDVVHCEFNYPFNDVDGLIIEVVERDKHWKTRYKYLVEVERRVLGFKITRREWFVGEQFFARKLHE